MSERFSGVVRNLSSKGYGVVEAPDGRVFFARGAWPGDEGTFEIEFCKRRYGQAFLVELHTPSPERVTPPCSYQGHLKKQCGGCPWMIADYTSQLHYKQHHLEHALERQKISADEGVIKKILPAPDLFSYRNRIQLKSDGVKLGLVAAQSNVIVDLKDCLVLNQATREILHQLILQLPNSNWRPRPPHHWNFIEIDDELDLVAIKKDLSLLTLNRRRVFRQGNSKQNQLMKEWVRKKVVQVTTRHQSTNLPAHFTAIAAVDLFSGSGNFTDVLALSKCFEWILAADSQSEAVEILRSKNLAGVTVMDMDLFLPGVWSKFANKLQSFIPHPPIELMVVNPPREGIEMRKEFLNPFPRLRDILYISCNPDTFARDAKDLIDDYGFQLIEVAPLDQFPHTAHLEIMAHFTRHL